MSLRHARPDGPSFSCSESNSEIFCRAVRTGNSFHPDGGRPNASGDLPDSQLTSLFVSFLTKPILSQSDI
jgi:hypothetical protein